MTHCSLHPTQRACSRKPRPARLLAALVIATLCATLFVFMPPVARAAGDSGDSGSTLPQIVSRVPTDDKVVALTFDAGSDAGHTLEILDILDDAGIKATFFLTGSWLESYPELGAAIAARGHDLGNHTDTHPHLTTLTDDEIRDEIEVTADLAEEACGRPLSPFFRPPFGEHDDRVDQVVGEAGYGYVIMWTIDSLDWEMIPADELTDRVVGGVQPGAIVLMHVGSQTNEPEALPRIIEQLKDEGYGFVTLSQLLGLDSGENVTYYTVRSGDTLSSIALRYGVSVADLLEVNALDDANAIEAGSLLIIPAPAGSDAGTTAPESGGDQGGHGSDEEIAPVAGGGSAAQPSFLARLWSAIGGFFSRLADFFRRIF